ncbi:MAG: LamG domain-containing protein, partial [Candidatus Heimdallarchaeaceae archaeon]
DSSHADNTAKVGDTNSTPAESVWDSNFKGVWHLTGASKTDLDDSTSNGNDITTEQGTPDYNTDGKIAKGVGFVRASSESVSAPDSNSVDMVGIDHLTFEAWVKPASVGVNMAAFAHFDYNGGNCLGYIWFPISTDGRPFLEVGDGSGRSQFYGVDTGAEAGNWYHTVGVVNESAGACYFNGSLNNSGALSGTFSGLAAASVSFDIGYEFTNYFDGVIDEVRLSDTNRSAAWIKASYNSGNDSLLTYGSEETAPSTFIPTIMNII